MSSQVNNSNQLVGDSSDVPDDTSSDASTSSNNSPGLQPSTPSDATASEAVVPEPRYPKRPNRNADSLMEAKKARKAAPAKQAYKKRECLELSPWKIQLFSSEWLAGVCLRSVHDQSQNRQMSEEAKEVFEGILRKVKDKNCYSYVLPIETPLPESDSFRGMGPVMKKYLLAEPLKAPSKKPNVAPSMRMNYTGHPYLNPETATSEQIVRLVMSGIPVYEEFIHKNNKFLPEGDTDLVQKEIDFFVNHAGHPQELSDNGYLPVAVYKVKDNSAEEMEKAKTLACTTSMCMFQNLTNVIGFDDAEFTVDKMNEIAPDYEIEVLRMIPQPPTHNFITQSKVGSQKSNQWDVQNFRHMIRIKEYAEYHNKMISDSKAAYESILEHPEESESILQNLQDKLRASSLPHVGFEVHKEATVIAFGTNIDLDDEEKFPKQAENVAKFPDFLAPHTNTNILNYAQESIKGLNKPQLYLKTPGSRTDPHLENSGLGSVNHNLGPDPCLWYGVPFEYAGAFQRLMTKRLNLTHGNKLDVYAHSYWGIESDCILEGIPLQKCIQKAGDTVFVGIGTFHWVQSIGFATNLSWNIGHENAKQLSTALLMHDNYAAAKQWTLMGIETILWNMVFQKIEVEDEMKKYMRSALMRSLGKAERELQLVQKKNMNVEGPPAPDGVQVVERCMLCSDCLFNFIPWTTRREMETPSTIKIKRKYTKKYEESDEESDEEDEDEELMEQEEGEKIKEENEVQVKEEEDSLEEEEDEMSEKPICFQCIIDNKLFGEITSVSQRYDMAELEAAFDGFKM
ncbi:unnamed protein product [Caenorhabditis nigoni]